MPTLRSCFSYLVIVLGLAVTAAAEPKLEPPVPVRTVSPEYPESMRKDGTMGVVVVKFTIDVQGNVVDPQVEKSSNPEFEQPAVEAVKKWKFKPARLDGNPVAKKVSIPIKFQLDS